MPATARPNGNKTRFHPLPQSCLRQLACEDLIFAGSKRYWLISPARLNLIHMQRICPAMNDRGPCRRAAPRASATFRAFPPATAVRPDSALASALARASNAANGVPVTRPVTLLSFPLREERALFNPHGVHPAPINLFRPT
jgi:hypothetical protein